MIGPGLFWKSLRARPFGVSAYFIVEYLMFFAGVGLALFLWSSRAPLRLFDRVFKTRVRERIVDILAFFSPG